MGGGGSKAQNSIDVVNQSIAESIMRSVSNCYTTIQQTQSVKIVDGSKVRGAIIGQDIALDLTCLARFQMTDQIAMDIAQKLMQDAQAKNVGFMSSVIGSGSKATTATNIQNIIKTTVRSENIQECGTKLSQDQSILVAGGSELIGASITQNIDAVTKCLMNTLKETQVAQRLVNVTGQASVAATADPGGALIEGAGDLGGKIVDTAGNLVGGVFDLFGGTTFYVLIAIIIIVIIAALLFKFAVPDEAKMQLASAASQRIAQPVPMTPGVQM